MSQSIQVRRAVSGLVQTHTFTPKAIISTIFGDMIAPHGGMVWLGSVVNAAKLFGIDESHARTSALRLVYDGWLQATRVGKLSYYSQSDESVRTYMPRIYGTPNESWGSEWFVVFTGVADIENKAYVSLRQALKWHGIGQLAPHVFVSPSADLSRVSRVLDEFGLTDRVQILKAEAVVGDNPSRLRTMVRHAWAIDEIEASYNRFLSRFRPIKQVLDKHAQAIDAESAFIIRTLLILEYRVIALRDPQLPAQLLPEQWSGHAAFTLCKSLYQQVLPGSEMLLAQIVRTPDGPFPPAGRMLWDRFGGLTPPEETPSPAG